MRYCVESECERARVPSHARTHALRMYGGHIERARLMVSGVFLTALLVIFAGCSGNEDVPTLIEKARQGDGKAAMKLVRTMGSADKDVALAAYRGVIDLGVDIQPWLARGLESPKDSVVEASAAALGNLGDSGSLPILIGILEGEGARRYAAAWALG